MKTANVQISRLEGREGVPTKLVKTANVQIGRLEGREGVPTRLVKTANVQIGRPSVASMCIDNI